MTDFSPRLFTTDAEIIRLGEADVMLSGGAHSMIHPFGVTGFNLLTALSTHNDNPQGHNVPRPKALLGELFSDPRLRIVELSEYASLRDPDLISANMLVGLLAEGLKP